MASKAGPLKERRGTAEAHWYGCGTPPLGWHQRILLTGGEVAVTAAGAREMA